MVRRYGIFFVGLVVTICATVSYAQNAMPGALPSRSNEIQEVQPPIAITPQDITLPPPVSLANGTPEELEKSGDDLREKKDYLQALDYYDAALRKAPTAILQNKIGMTYITMGRYDKAKDSLKRATKMDKNYAEAFNNYGVVCHMTKKYKDAVKYYRKAIALRDTSASFHSNLATSLVEMKKYDEAMPEYQRAFDLDPDVFERSSRTGISARMSSPEDRARFSYVLAKLYAGKGNVEKSLYYLRRALEDGYTEINNVYKDSDFATLRKDERFTELMAAKPAAIPQ
jgi:tetratricopeptide (TPR) repeat protein